MKKVRGSISRRSLLASAALCATTGAGAQPAYPDRPIRIVVPYSAASGADTIARALAPRLSVSLGQPVSVENRDGAGGVVGTLAVLNAPSDGYTLLLQGNPFTMAPSFSVNPPFDPLSDFLPIAKLAIVPLAFLVHPSLPIHNMKEFVNYARANPGKLTYASSGPGTGSQVEMELLKRALNIDVLEIPYKSTSQAVTDLLGGQVSAYTAALPSVAQHVRSGRARAIALVSMARSPLFPDIQSVPEGLGRPDYVSSPNWYALYAHSRTPSSIVTVLQKQVQQIMRSPAMREQLEGFGAQSVDSTVEDLTAQMHSDVRRYIEVGKVLGLRK